MQRADPRPTAGKSLKGRSCPDVSPCNAAQKVQLQMNDSAAFAAGRITRRKSPGLDASARLQAALLQHRMRSRRESQHHTSMSMSDRDLPVVSSRAARRVRKPCVAAFFSLQILRPCTRTPRYATADHGICEDTEDHNRRCLNTTTRRLVEKCCSQPETFGRKLSLLKRGGAICH